MKVAITAEGPTLQSHAEVRFGRAKWLIVVDSETGESEAHDNAVNLNAVQGAGIQRGLKVSHLAVEALITGNIGPNAMKTLRTAKVKVFLSKVNTVQEAVELFKAGELEEVKQAIVEGHWV